MSADPWTIIARVDGGHEIDPNEVSRALRLYLEPGEYYTVQGLPSARARLISADDMLAAVETVRGLADDRGVYVTLNPVPKTLGDKAPKNNDIVRRTRLLIDVDALKAKPDEMATEDEKAGAWQVASAIVAELEGRGWPAPVVIDSGNGVHLVYAIDLPCTPLAKQYAAAALKALAAHHDGPAKVDTKVFDAKRITKLPGTWVRKGPNTPDRPHRLARIMYAPERLAVVTREQLQEVAGIKAEGDEPTPEPAPMPRRDPWVMLAGASGPGDLSRYVQAAINAEMSRLATSLPPAHGGEGRNNALNAAAFSLATLDGWPEFNAAAAKAELRLVAERVGLDPREIDRTIESGWTSGLQNPRQRPEPRANGKVQDDGAAAVNAARQAGRSLVVWANTVTPKKVEFLWPGRIPLGKMTTFAGHGGLGKTFTLCDIAARVTQGMEWPFGGGECAERGKVLFISGEDDVDDTLVPRLLESGADLRKVAFLSPESEDHFSLAALELLTSVLGEMGPDVRFVVIDPPTSYLGGVDDHKNAELRGLLTPLKRWAAANRVAIVLNNHVNKATGPNIDAASRVMGSVAWVNAVRAAHMFVRDTDDKDKVLFVPLKLNIAKRPQGLSYRIVTTRDDLARVEWLAEIDQTADEALGATKKPGGRNAADWLIDMFNRRREWPSDLFWKELKAGSVTEHQLRGVRDALAIPKARRVAQPDGSVEYVWWIPPDWPHLNGARNCGIGGIETEDVAF